MSKPMPAKLLLKRNMKLVRERSINLKKLRKTIRLMFRKKKERRLPKSRKNKLL